MNSEISTSCFRQPKFWLAWLSLGIVGGATGFFFSWSLTEVTKLSIAHPWLLYFLPLGGVLIFALYHWDEKNTRADQASADAGSKSLAQYLRGGEKKPRRTMLPLILLGTLATHLFGGSAGREGTALQMGGGLAAGGLDGGYDERGRRILLSSGMAACFAAVFGTPLAAAFFCLELWQFRPSNIYKLRSLLTNIETLFTGIITTVLVFAAAWMANVYAHRLGVKHTDFVSLVPHATLPWSSPLWWGKCLLLAASCALAVWIFHGGMQSIRYIFTRYLTKKWLHPVIGGLCIIVMFLCTQNPDYLGLGVEPRRDDGVCIISAFSHNGAAWWSWLAKLGYTVVTLASGFKGGEVTPLFFIGATLGNAIAILLKAPVATFAAAGMTAVFAAASRGPIACVIMGCELFGWHHLPTQVLVCLAATLMASRHGIYDSDS